MGVPIVANWSLDFMPFDGSFESEIQCTEGDVLTVDIDNGFKGNVRVVSSEFTGGVYLTKFKFMEIK